MSFWRLFCRGKKEKYSSSSNEGLLPSASLVSPGGYPQFSKDELPQAKPSGFKPVPPSPLHQKGGGYSTKGELSGFESDLSIVNDANAYDFLWTIKSFSLLSGVSESRQTSGRFNAKSLTWKLVCYPNGNLIEDQISVYLMLSKAADHPSEAVFKVSYELFLFDQNNGSTFTRRGENLAQVFDEIGFRNFKDLSEFRSSSKGYLVKDCCMFGVKILQVVPIKTITECLHPVEKITHEFSWKIENFSSLDKKISHEKHFTAGQYLWSILLHPDPTGDKKSHELGKNFSIYLYYYGSVRDESAAKVSAEFSLSVIDQIGRKHKKLNYTEVFKSTHPGWGKKDFMLKEDLEDPSLGFLINDTLIIEAKVAVLALVK
ncbi:Ubiquitin carboxyl-terminal hydrolase 13 [Apostasia shenzhenica]|uniref:Ubiquitin carboxyl-terminal hydrolase 13 n=1 Tax=Apostasia shenzhenica TaxID=1088818 RepID=A0A2H9ZZA8_9ASPA|nr:Ubiquitin carboxyl-terminal hydrolase 13 [Apostasia shenzhenica]